MSAKEPELTKVSSKGQIVIPKAVREDLKIRPRTTLLVYGKGDSLILKKYKAPAAVKKIEKLFRAIDRRSAKFGKLTEREIAKEIALYRKAKSKPSTG